MARLKLKRATYRHIEAEIYAYWETLQAIEDLRRDIILGEQEEAPKVSGGGYVGSFVENRATRLADSVLLREMQRITKAIQDTYARAKEDCRNVVYIKYGLSIDWEPPQDVKTKVNDQMRFNAPIADLAGIMSVDERTFYRYRSGFVYGIAERLGWW